MRVAIGLGSSLGDRIHELRLATFGLCRGPEVQLVATSSVYRTPPMRGGTARGWFLNAVVLVETELDPDDVLLRCITLEQARHRRRARYWGDRTIDLDVLHAEGIVREGQHLRLPHPGLLTRPFVTIPLLEVWPEATDPRTARPYADLAHPRGPRPVRVGHLGLAPRRAWK